MRASEFIIEREEWSHMPDPTMQKQFDAWKQEERGRNALTTMPVPKTSSGYKLGPDSPFVPSLDPADLLNDPEVAKAGGFPKGWTQNDPARLTRKMLDPITGDVQLGPDVVVKPGTEEYAELRRRTNPVTGSINLVPNARIPARPSAPPSQEQEKRSQREIPVGPRDQDKKMSDPVHPMDKQYRYIDHRREKYRT